MAKVKVTVGQVQAKLGPETTYAQASGLMGVLVAKGLAVATGEKVRKDGANGKGATVYEVEDKVTIQLV
jgi:hypothetical protein